MPKETNLFLRLKKKHEAQVIKREAEFKAEKAKQKANAINPLNVLGDFLARTVASGGNPLIGATALLDPKKGEKFDPSVLLSGTAAGVAGKGLSEVLGKGGGDIVKGIGEATKAGQVGKTMQQVSALTQRESAVPSLQNIIKMTQAEETAKTKAQKEKKKETRETKAFELKEKNILSQIAEREGKEAKKADKDEKAIAAEELDGQLDNQNIQDLSDIEKDLTSKELDFYSAGEGFELKKSYRDRDKKNIKAIRASKSLSGIEKTKKINKIKKFQKERERKFF